MPKVIQPLTPQIWTCLNRDNTFYSVDCCNNIFHWIKELEDATFKRPSYHRFFLAPTPDEDESPYKRRRSDTMEDQANEKLVNEFLSLFAGLLTSSQIKLYTKLSNTLIIRASINHALRLLISLFCLSSVHDFLTMLTFFFSLVAQTVYGIDGFSCFHCF